MNANRIVHVADYSAPFASNFIASLLRLAERTRARLRLDSRFVFPVRARNRPWIRSFHDAGSPVEFVDRQASHRGRVRALERIAREAESRILHTHFGTFDVDAAYVAWRIGCEAIWHMHSPYPYYDEVRRRIGERIKFQAVSRLFVDSIVAVSASVAESALRRGAPPSKFTIVPNGIDLDRARRLDDATRTALRRRYGIREQEIVFLLFGWSPMRKGVDLFVDASLLIPPPVSAAARCLVVSGGENEDVLRQMARKAPSIRVIPPVEDVRELYALADCFVSASRSEGLPYAVGEAMGSELPVISSDLPQVVGVYGPAGTGLLTFRTGDARDLADAMVRVLRLPPLEHRRLGLANRAYVERDLSLDRWCERIVDLYQSLLSSTAAPSSR